ncbi:MAG: amidohydrolase family protein [Bacteroidales bacterium]|nr:amidohydrolase family protein [Bacteroidales bacterium]
MISHLIYNARVVNEGRSFLGFVAVGDDGLIAEVGEGMPSQEMLAQAKEAVDTQGWLLLPGAIDVHVHFRDPGLTHKGDFATESMAALKGGVTSVIDMPNVKPVTVTLADWERKMERAAQVSHVNYSAYFGATADNIPSLMDLDYSRVAGVKLFLGSSTGNMLLNDPATLRQLLSTVPAVIAVHAENDAMVKAGMEWAKREFEGGEVPIPMHSAIRSRRACFSAAKQIIELARETGARLHLLHVSTQEELALLDAGGVGEKRVTAETCPHYLLLSAYDYPRLGAKMKCNPAIKLPSDAAALRQALLDGRIDTIGTDHAPHLWSEKHGDALTAASGMPSIQFALPLMLDMLPPEVVVEKMAHNPARIFGIVRRGFLRPGYHADMVLVSPTEWTVTRDDILSPCGWSPYEGRTLNHRVERTFLSTPSPLHFYR